MSYILIRFLNILHLSFFNFRAIKIFVLTFCTLVRDKHIHNLYINWFNLISFDIYQLHIIYNSINLVNLSLRVDSIQMCQNRRPLTSHSFIFSIFLHFNLLIISLVNVSKIMIIQACVSHTHYLHLPQFDLKLNEFILTEFNKWSTIIWLKTSVS